VCGLREVIGEIVGNSQFTRGDLLKEDGNILAQMHVF
jgi:hypothetical protein